MPRPPIAPGEAPRGTGRVGMLASVRARLALWHAAVVALFLLIFAAGSFALLRNVLLQRVDDRLEETAHTFAGALLLEHASSPATLAGSDAVREFRFRELQIVVYDAADRPVASTGETLSRPGSRDRGKRVAPPPLRLDTAFLARVRRTGPAFATLDAPRAPERLYALPVQLGPRPYVVVLVQSLANPLVILRQARVAFLAAFPLALSLAGLAGYALARRSLQPVVAMSGQAARISASTLHERLPVRNERDELGQLATVFNELLSRLDAAFEQQRRFMADASHELRTPVAIMRAEADVALARSDRPAAEYQAALRIVGDEGRRMTAIVNDLFLLARADAGQLPITPRPLYLDELAVDCVRAMRTLATRRAIAIETEVDGDVAVRGDEAMLRRLVLNLLDNAVKYTPPGGRITVRIDRADAVGRLTVADTGPGIPRDAHDRVFERFYRSDGARSRDAGGEGGGAGLGLAIARWVADAHGGRLALDGSRLTGAAVVLELPMDVEREP